MRWLRSQASTIERYHPLQDMTTLPSSPQLDAMRRAGYSDAQTWDWVLSLVRKRSQDLTFLDNAKGVVLKDDAGTPHYWRITVSSLGVLAVTDTGTTPP